MLLAPPEAPLQPTPSAGAPVPTPPGASTGSSFIVDRGRIDRAPPTALPSAADGSSAQGAGGRVAAAGELAAPFVLRGLRLEGASASDAVLRPVLRRFVGRRMDAAGLKVLAEAVSAAYAKADVALYTVLLPQQDFAGGVVGVRVVEGYVEAVEVKTAAGRPARQVALYARRLMHERPLRRTTLEHAFLLMRALPGVTVDAQFLRGGGDGAVRLVVTVHRKRVQFGVGVSDRGANRLGRTQVEADLTVNSLLRDGDRTALVLAAPTDFTRFRYYALSHTQPLGSGGLTATASLGYLSTRPRGSSMRGEAKIGSLSLSYPLQLQADRSLVLTGSLDALDSANALFGVTLSDERTRTIRVAAAYARTLDPKTNFSLGGTVSQGLPGLGARPVAPGFSDTDFHKVSLQAAATKAYGRWTVRVRATAQASGDRLPASEQLALGGDDFGRAFESATVTGDQGAAGSLELAWAASAVLPKVLAGSEVYAFTDGGRVRFKGRPLYGTAGATYDLASAGLGLRAAVAAHTVLQLEASRQVVARLPQGASGDWRLVFGYRTNY